jgi:decaprenylphospho-beta-D-erythro-pentofuranosid-2-ulose 2-reductase
MSIRRSPPASGGASVADVGSAYPPRPNRTPDVQRVLAFGGTSVIAQAVLRRLAAQGAAVCMVGRNADRLQIVADDLAARGSSRAVYRVIDFRDYSAYDMIVSEAAEQLGGLDLVIVAHGQLSDQARSRRDVTYMVDQLHVNLVSAVVAVGVAADRFEAQGSGTIIVLGSVAGDRGRRSNYVYGSAKAALAAFSEGVRHRLRPSGARVILVKPGLVDTPMTSRLKKNPLYATPDRVASDVLGAIRDGRDVVYSPFWWRYVMAAIRALPGWIFLRLPL